MNIKRINEIVVALVLAAAMLPSCSKGAWEPAAEGTRVTGEREPETVAETAGTHVTRMTLSPSEAGRETRSKIVETEGAGNRKVTWAAADKIHYWTSDAVAGTPSAKQTHLVLADTEKEEIPVTYRDNDQYVTFYTAGESISATTSNMTDITFTVPQNQDGTFAGCHAAVYKSKVILDAPAAAMKPVVAMLRFTMSTLTYADKTVDNIRVGCMSTSWYVWGDSKVTMDNTNLGEVASVTYLTGTSTSSPIKIDKSASTFTVNTPYYVAIRSNASAYASGIYIDLYNGSTKLGRVLVKDSSSGGLTMTHGKIIDVGDLKAHVKIQAKTMTLYPNVAAFTKDMTKKFWLRVEPSDFNGTVSWSLASGNTGYFTITAGSRENLTIDGETVSCYTAVLKPSSSATTYDRRTVVIRATASVTTGESAVTKDSGTIEMGKFVDMGLKDAAGKRLLWSTGYISGDYDSAHWNRSDETSTGTNTLAWTNDASSASVYYWGYVHSGAPTTYTNRWANGASSTGYTAASPVFPLLDNADNVAYRCKTTKYTGEDANWDMPTAEEVTNFVFSTTRSGSGTVTATSKMTGYTDCSMTFSTSMNTKTGITGSSQKQYLYFWVSSSTAFGVQYNTRSSGSFKVKPVKHI